MELWFLGTMSLLYSKTVTLQTKGQLKGTAPAAIVESAVSTFPDFDVKSVQFRPNSEILITFASPEQKQAVLQKEGAVLCGQSCKIVGGKPPSTVVQVHHYPYEFPDAPIKTKLSEFGEVLNIRHQVFPGFPNIFTGTRLVRMIVKKEIPKDLLISSSYVSVWYKGQPLVCNICNERGHKAAVCPLRGKCRRCRQPGHIARYCRNNPWASAVESTVPPEPTGEAGDASVPPEVSEVPPSSVDVTVDPPPLMDIQIEAPPESAAPSSDCGDSFPPLPPDESMDLFSDPGPSAEPSFPPLPSPSAVVDSNCSEVAHISTEQRKKRHKRKRDHKKESIVDASKKPHCESVLSNPSSSTPSPESPMDSTAVEPASVPVATDARSPPSSSPSDVSVHTMSPPQAPSHQSRRQYEPFLSAERLRRAASTDRSPAGSSRNSSSNLSRSQSVGSLDSVSSN